MLAMILCRSIVMMVIYAYTICIYSILYTPTLRTCASPPYYNNIIYIYILACTGIDRTGIDTIVGIPYT